MCEAWKLAQAQVKKAQKTQRDRKCNSPFYQPGERVFVYMPAEKACKAHKIAKAFHGPYRVIEWRWDQSINLKPTPFNWV